MKKAKFNAFRTSFLVPALLVMAGTTPALLQAQTFTFSTGHVDVGIAYEAGAWDLHVHDEGTDAEISPANLARLQVNAAARTTVPGSPSYSFLGSPGSDVWVLPKSENSSLLFLGFATEELNAVEWTENISFTLKNISGPGHFAAWDVDGFGNPTALMNSRDGITSGDAFSLIPGSHAHYNLGFSAPGDYSIFFEASSVHTLDGFTQSGDVEYRFTVIPEPSTYAFAGAAALLAFGIVRRFRGRAALNAAS